jgi:hypothetical protein
VTVTAFIGKKWAIQKEPQLFTFMVAPGVVVGLVQGVILTPKPIVPFYLTSGGVGVAFRLSQSLNLT